MSAAIIRYVVGAIMLVFSVWQIYRNDYWEFALYFCAGIAFVIMGLLTDDVFPRARKFLNIVSWVFIILAVLLFLFLLRTDPV